MQRRAFTLIELMLAMAIGSMLVYIAFAGFRVASQCVTISNRLSLENSLMRVGYAEAHEYLDFWTDLDDPDDPAKQRLRQTDNGYGLPFTPFSVTMPAVNQGDADQEKHRGWESGNKWKAADPATWWRGALVEPYLSDLRFGRYSIFANTERDLTLTTDPAYDYTDPDPNLSRSALYGDVKVKHNWLYNQYQDLCKALQFYGMADYVPANALYSYYTPYKQYPLAFGDYYNGEAPLYWLKLDEGTNRGGIPLMLIMFHSRFANTDGAQGMVRGLWRATQGTGLGVVRPDLTPTPSAAELVDWNMRYYGIGYLSTDDSMRLFRQRTEVPSDLVPQRPETWPSATTAVERYIRARRFISLCRVRWSNPVTGQIAATTFTGIGSTLRGARQQRKPDGGWARWDNGPSPIYDPTLDTP